MTLITPGSFDHEVASIPVIGSAGNAMRYYDDHGREAYALALLLEGDRDSAVALLVGIFDDPELGASLASAAARHGERVALLLEVVRAHRRSV